jgi:hypothetical protein
MFALIHAVYRPRGGITYKYQDVRCWSGLAVNGRERLEKKCPLQLDAD